jgi:mono/diheme cytochrome c family protein
MKQLLYLSVFCVLCISIGCSPAGGNRRGHEFMPDMVHTTGYEANLYDYYWYNRWGTEAEYKSFVNPKHSVPGTVARGQVMWADAPNVDARMSEMEAFEGETEGSIALTPNGSVPYYYKDTEEERARATKEITTNPFPITSSGLIHGKELYLVYCGICHGDKGDGQGYLVREGDPAKGIVAGVYPAAPANFMLDTFLHATPGRFYHAIMFGRNVMGSYADKLSYKERWEVIHYIRSLQATFKKAEYSPALNTFNNESTPWAVVEANMKKEMAVLPGDTTKHDNAPAPGNTNTNHH